MRAWPFPPLHVPPLLRTPAEREHVADFSIQGMTCAACAARVEKVLNRVPGVSATVNFATEKARVAYPDGLRPEDIMAAVRKAGYGALPVADVREEDEARRAGTGARRARALLDLGRTHRTVHPADGPHARDGRARVSAAVGAARSGDARSVLDRETLLHRRMARVEERRRQHGRLVALGTSDGVLL